MSKKFKKPRSYPLAWAVLALLAIIVLDRWFPLQQLVAPPFNMASSLFTVPGLAILLQSGMSFIKAKTGLLPFSETTSLVTTGSYRFTRNPMYLGMVLLLLGMAVFLGSLSALFPVLIFAWIIDRNFIRNEEIFLEEIFGEDYLGYKKQVRRWI
jgi:protein-S-isoprenylcysteine O-methyltransferase Ste14